MTLLKNVHWFQFLLLFVNFKAQFPRLKQCFDNHFVRKFAQVVIRLYSVTFSGSQLERKTAIGQWYLLQLPWESSINKLAVTHFASLCFLVMWLQDEHLTNSSLQSSIRELQFIQSIERHASALKSSPCSSCSVFTPSAVISSSSLSIDSGEYQCSPAEW